LLSFPGQVFLQWILHICAKHHLARFLPITISLTDLGNWQPSITIVPRGDGTFTYAPTSAVVTGDSSTTHDVVYHSNIWG